MADARRFWEPIDPDDPEQLWRPPPPATPEEIRAWEQEHSVRLPARLAAALTVQNGGRVRGTISLDLNPLCWIKSLLDEGCEHYHEEYEVEVVGRGRMFTIGNEHGCEIVLDYREKDDPSILRVDHNCEGEVRDDGIGSFDDFLKGRGDEAPVP